MLTQPARVLSVSDQQVIVETLSKANCPKCAQGIGCGGGILAKLFGDKTFKLSFPLEQLTAQLTPHQAVQEAVQEQQMVQLGMSERLLVKAAFILYGLPLLLLMLSAIIASLVISLEWLIIFTAIGGFVLGMLLAKKSARQFLSQPANRPSLIVEATVGCFDGAS